MSKPKQLEPLPEFAWAVISPWTRRPFVYRGLRFVRKDLVKQLNHDRNENLTLGQWRTRGFRFVRVKIEVIATRRGRP